MVEAATKHTAKVTESNQNIFLTQKNVFALKVNEGLCEVALRIGDGFERAGPFSKLCVQTMQNTTFLRQNPEIRGFRL